jgi:hypothetical protein
VADYTLRTIGGSIKVGDADKKLKIIPLDGMGEFGMS